VLNPRLSDFADFEKQSRLILNLGLQLAQAHRASLDNFLTDSKKSLNYLRFLLLTSLALLLLAGAGLAVAVYRELIAPLRVKLVESQALVERQEKLADDVDAILDEIDEVLEENAEEFVRSYVQKGGQ